MKYRLVDSPVSDDTGAFMADGVRSHTTIGLLSKTALSAPYTLAIQLMVIRCNDKADERHGLRPSGL